VHWVDSMHANDFDAQMQPFLSAIEEYGVQAVATP
jgi:hypothetical protein